MSTSHGAFALVFIFELVVNKFSLFTVSSCRGIQNLIIKKCKADSLFSWNVHKFSLLLYSIIYSLLKKSGTYIFLMHQDSILHVTDTKIENSNFFWIFKNYLY
jgi:tRNA(Phe) wybutosine-synthesizing methylase Tyw3